ncbi:MAG: hypothetical protein ACK5JM_05770 [Rhodoblastus sp.]
MLSPARLALGLVLPLATPLLLCAGPALAGGGHGRMVPIVVRPAAAAGIMPAAPGARVVHLQTRPTYGPPNRPVYGPPQNQFRRDGRHRGGRQTGADSGLYGWPGYGSGEGGGSARAVAVSEGGGRPRPSVMYNFNGPPPLWQGDAGYVSQPVIYDVETVLRRYPGAGPHIYK